MPDQILTDNAKVFTGRFGPSAGGEVLFDRICRENGTRHLLTAPRSPTTTGKVERWHKTLRQEFLTGKVFESISDAQAQLDGWVRHYNFQRRHQGIGDVVPWERFRLAVEDRPAVPTPVRSQPAEAPAASTAIRKVSVGGKISFAAQPYAVGVWLAGETVEVATDAGLVTISHRGVVVATHAQRHTPAKGAKAASQTQTPAQPEAASADGGSGGDPQGRLCGLCVVRGGQLPRRPRASGTPGPGRDRRQQRGDHCWWGGAAGASDPP